MKHVDRSMGAGEQGDDLSFDRKSGNWLERMIFKSAAKRS